MKWFIAIFFIAMTAQAEVMQRGDSKMVSADEIIKKLGLEPLPNEGGFYRETYRSNDDGVPASLFGIDSESTRKISTAIYYLVVPDNFSALHRVKSDEMFHFYSGDPVEMIQFGDDGKIQRFILGPNILNGETPQVLVPKGVWQALKLRPGGKWALMGTTVAPGFEFEDFELGHRDELTKQFPHLEKDIVRFTRVENEKGM